MKFEIVNGKLQYLPRDGVVEEEKKTKKPEQADINKTIMEGQQKCNEIYELLDEAIKYTDDKSDSGSETLTKAAGMAYELQSMLTGMSDVNEAVVIATGTGKTDPHYAKRMLHALKKVINGELKVDGKAMKDMFDKFNKIQLMEPFFDHDHHGQEGKLRDEIDSILDKCNLESLKKILKSLKNDGED